MREKHELLFCVVLACSGHADHDSFIDLASKRREVLGVGLFQLRLERRLGHRLCDPDQPKLLSRGPARQASQSVGIDAPSRVPPLVRWFIA